MHFRKSRPASRGQFLGLWWTYTERVHRCRILWHDVEICESCYDSESRSKPSSKTVTSDTACICDDAVKRRNYLLRKALECQLCSQVHISVEFYFSIVRIIEKSELKLKRKTTDVQIWSEFFVEKGSIENVFDKYLWKSASTVFHIALKWSV